MQQQPAVAVKVSLHKNMFTFKEYIVEASKINLSRAKLMRDLDSLSNKIIDNEISIRSFTQYLKKTLTSSVDCEVTQNKSPAVSPNTVNITAFYDQDADEDEDVPFEFILVYNPKDSKIKLSKKYWTWFKNELVDAIMHEMMHQSQAHSRKFGVNSSNYLKGETEDQSYYGKRDEVEAYAMNSAQELLRSYGSAQKAAKALSNPSSIKDKNSPSLDRYMKAFQSPSHPIMKVFLKKVYFFLYNK